MSLLVSSCLLGVCVGGGGGIWGCHVIKWLPQGTLGWEDTVCAVGAEGKFQAWLSPGAGPQVAACGAVQSVEVRVASHGGRGSQVRRLRLLLPVSRSALG